MTEGLRRAFVVGHPIGHSRSPMIHRHWLAQHGLRGDYVPLDVVPSDFPAFVRSFGSLGYVGGNVTIPHKETAWQAADTREESAEAVGAVNTLWLEGGRIAGANTDVHGFLSNLDDRVPGWDRSSIALVLGAGGAARAVVHGLTKRGIREVRIVNRTLSRARELADRFGTSVSAFGTEALHEIARDARLVVNVTPLGMGSDGGSALDPDILPDDAIVNDTVYVPLETPLLAAARARGLRTVDGLGMLLHQAAPAFARWFGITPVVSAELRALIAADLERSR